MKGALIQMKKQLFKHKAKGKHNKKTKPHPQTKAEAKSTAIAPRKADWKTPLTASLDQNCIAPSEDAILYASEIFFDELNAPIVTLETELASLYADLVDHVAALNALAPDMMERAISHNAIDLIHSNKNEEVE